MASRVMTRLVVLAVALTASVRGLQWNDVVEWWQTDPCIRIQPARIAPFSPASRKGDSYVIGDAVSVSFWVESVASCRQLSAEDRAQWLAYADPRWLVNRWWPFRTRLSITLDLDQDKGGPIRAQVASELHVQLLVAAWGRPGGEGDGSELWEPHPEVAHIRRRLVSLVWQIPYDLNDASPKRIGSPFIAKFSFTLQRKLAGSLTVPSQAIYIFPRYFQPYDKARDSPLDQRCMADSPTGFLDWMKGLVSRYPGRFNHGDIVRMCFHSANTFQNCRALGIFRFMYYANRFTIFRQLVQDVREGDLAPLGSRAMALDRKLYHDFEFLEFFGEPRENRNPQLQHWMDQFEEDLFGDLKGHMPLSRQRALNEALRLWQEITSACAPGEIAHRPLPSLGWLQALKNSLPSWMGVSASPPVDNLEVIVRGFALCLRHQVPEVLEQYMNALRNHGDPSQRVTTADAESTVLQGASGSGSDGNDGPERSVSLHRRSLTLAGALVTGMGAAAVAFLAVLSTSPWMTPGSWLSSSQNYFVWMRRVPLDDLYSRVIGHQLGFHVPLPAYPDEECHSHDIYSGDCLSH